MNKHIVKYTGPAVLLVPVAAREPVESRVHLNDLIYLHAKNRKLIKKALSKIGTIWCQSPRCSAPAVDLFQDKFRVRGPGSILRLLPATQGKTWEFR